MDVAMDVDVDVDGSGASAAAVVQDVSAAVAAAAVAAATSAGSIASGALSLSAAIATTATMTTSTTSTTTITTLAAAVVASTEPETAPAASLFSSMAAATAALLRIVFGGAPWLLFRLLSRTVTATITLELWAVLALAAAVTTAIYLLIRYRILNTYSRLRTPAPPTPRAPFDLQPDSTLLDDSDRPKGYPDDFMNAFLSSIKVFGYLDKPVFHELARHLQTRKLAPGEVLLNEDSDDRDFYVVVDGRVQIFVRGSAPDSSSATAASASMNGVHPASHMGLSGVNVGAFSSSGGTHSHHPRDMHAPPQSPGTATSSHGEFDFDTYSDVSDADEEYSGYHLLNEVKSGETVSSLFTILSLFTEDFDIPNTLTQQDKRRQSSVTPNAAGAATNVASMLSAVVDATSTSGIAVPPTLSPMGTIPDPITEKDEQSDTTAATSATAPSRRQGHQRNHSSGIGRNPQSVFPGLTPRHSRSTRTTGVYDSAGTNTVPSDVESPVSTDIADILDTPEVHHRDANVQTSTSDTESHEPSARLGNLPLPPKPKPRSVHPSIVARASTATTLAVIPAAAFRKLTEKFPNAAAHIVQVILTRFQRVTFLTLYRYLGLSRELLRIERQVNQFSGYGLPADLFPPEALHELRLRTIRYRHDPRHAAAAIAGGSISVATQAVPKSRVNHSHMPMSPSSSTPASAITQSRDSATHSPTAASSSRSGRDRASNKQQQQTPPPTASTAQPQTYLVLNSDEDETMKESIFQCIAQLIGMRTYPNTTYSERSTHASRHLLHHYLHTHGHAYGQHGGGFGGGGSSGLAAARASVSGPVGISPMMDRLYTARSRGVNTKTGVSGGGSGSSSSVGGGGGGPVFSVGATPLRSSSLVDHDEISSQVSSRSNSISNMSVESSDHHDIEIRFFTQGQTLVAEGERNAGLYFVLDGVLEAAISSSQDQLFPSRPESGLHGDYSQTSGNGTGEDPAGRKRHSRRHLFLIHPGGLAGYLAALTGHTSFVTIRAKTDVHVGFMSKHALDKQVERCPDILLCLAKRLVNQLSPLVFHIDVALGWGQLNAGQVLCRQDDPSTSIYIVLAGRLRAIVERVHTGKDSLEILGEYGQLESVGEMEVLMDMPRTATIHAIRDTEIAIMPKTLFNALAIRHPEITIAISRIIAARSNRSSSIGGDGGRVIRPLLSPDFSNSVDSGNNNVNLKTVAILPVISMVPVVEFAERLRDALQLVGESVAMLHTATVMRELGKHAFTRLGRLKLMSWLAEQEESHRLVLYVADGGVNSPWTQRCVRQADCILLVGLGDGDPAVGEFERLLVGMKTTARKELVLLHNQRACIHGSTAQWLKNRLWVHAHHHVQMRLNTPTILDKAPPKQLTLVNLRSHFQRYYTRIYSSTLSSHGKKASAPNIFSGVRSDFARLARRLLSRSIGLVLGGGGARGLSHIGIIRAFEEAGIPIDMIGGTSIGSFVGGCYARENDHVSVYGRAKMFSSRIVSTWRSLIDLTYPVTALFTGHEFNRGVWKVFLESQIEDCWIPFFAVTTNITWSRMEVHQTGYMWRYIRASMSLSGYVPPLCDHGNMLLDGGYINNLPADVMRSLGADTIVAVDVSLADDTSPVHYGDSVSGWWVLLNRLNPFSPSSAKILSIADIQSRLAYVSSVKQLEDAKRLDGCLYLHPPIAPYRVMDFGKPAEIFDVGYRYGKEVVQQWALDGTLQRRFGVRLEDSGGRKSVGGRRNSI